MLGPRNQPGRQRWLQRSSLPSLGDFLKSIRHPSALPINRISHFRSLLRWEHHPVKSRLDTRWTSKRWLLSIPAFPTFHRSCQRFGCSGLFLCANFTFSLWEPESSKPNLKSFLSLSFYVLKFYFKKRDLYFLNLMACQVLWKSLNPSEKRVGNDCWQWLRNKPLHHIFLLPPPSGGRAIPVGHMASQ